MLNSQNLGDGRIYLIQGAKSFVTGAANNQRQVIMGLYAPEILAVFFDFQGVVMGVETRQLLVPRLTAHPNVYAVHDSEFRRTFAQALTAWQLEIAFATGPIAVRKFALADRAIGITDRPDYLTAFSERCSDSNLSQSDQRIADQLERWDRERMYVFMWGNEHWMKRDGTLHST